MLWVYKLRFTWLRRIAPFQYAVVAPFIKGWMLHFVVTTHQLHEN